MLTLVYAHKSYTLENGEAISAMKGAIKAREAGDFAKGAELFSKAVKLENAGCTPGGVPLPAPVVEGMTIEDPGLSVMGPDYTPVYWRDAVDVLDETVSMNGEIVLGVVPDFPRHVECQNIPTL